jgi:hypothetical protein
MHRMTTRKEDRMRIESSVTSVSWIPSEAISGINRLPMDLGIGHYDPAPPDHIDDSTLDELKAADRLRAANRLAAWIEVEDGQIVDAGYSGRAVVGSTTGGIGRAKITFPGIGFPVLQEEPVIENGVARFVQSVGARTGAPLPRRIDRPPYVRITGPTTWVTLGLEIGVDGTVRHEVVGASPFPRHWIYDSAGTLVGKSGLVDWSEWTRVHDHDRSPWGGVEREAIVTEVESQMERALSGPLMGLKPQIRKLAAGDTLTIQGESGDELYLVLDGMFEVDVDGETVAEIGPGAIVGERAVLEGGVRTSTVKALTAAKVAAVDAAGLDAGDLAEVASRHRREEG